MLAIQDEANERLEAAKDAQLKQANLVERLQVSDIFQR